MKLLRLIYNISILAIFILGIIKLIQKDYFLAFIWIFLTPFLMLLPRNLYKIRWINHKYNKNLVYLFEFLALISLYTGAGLTLGLKKLPIDFDSFNHLINTLIYTIMFGILYYIIKNKITGKEIKKQKVAIFAFIFVMIFGVVLWEQFQIYGDKIFGTQMYSDYFQDINLDTKLDQMFGIIGTLTGSILLYFKFDNWINKWRR
ncbi:MAG: hypothetical protein AABW45_02005 [Nanoarchaeota archaeon]